MSRATRRAHVSLPTLLVALVAGLVWPLVAAQPARADRVVGGAPLDELMEAAQETAGTCPGAPSRSRTATQLVAMVVAPTYPETGAPATAAPAPMTLSRWDNQAALASFGDRSTHPLAFWHPGIGAWQWDDASGRGWTAAERIRADVVVARTVEVMFDRWCRTTLNNRDGRAYVWAPWHGCGGGTCEAIYQELVDGPSLVGLVGDPSVSTWGGVRSRTCTNGGQPFTCWYVDPQRAQGHRAFLSPSFGPAPVSAPFYSWSAGGREHRVWLREDTGDDVDVAASLAAGANSRTSLAWSTQTNLCDLDRSAGACATVPPSGFVQVEVDFGPSRLPLAGDFDGDGFDDLFLYGPGATADALWMGGPTSFTTRAVSVKGTYEPLVGDFDGDGRSDILWYGAGASPDRIWFGAANRFDTDTTSVRGVYDPVVGDFDGDGRSDVLWYGPGGDRDSAWYGRSNGAFAFDDVSVQGTYEPRAGDFDGNDTDDVLWYGPGAADDRLWAGTGRRGVFAYKDATINGVYRSGAGDLDGDGVDDLLLHGPGPDPDRLLYASGNHGFRSVKTTIGGDFRIAVGDFDASGAADVVYAAPDGSGLVWWSQ